MPINHHNALAQQQRRINVRVAQSDSYAFFNLLTGPAFLDQVESLLPEHRERLFPPTETLSMFLAQVLSSDGSCRQAVDDAAVTVDMDEWPERVLLSNEKEALGLYLTGHPVALQADELSRFTTCTLDSLERRFGASEGGRGRRGAKAVLAEQVVQVRVMVEVQ